MRECGSSLPVLNILLAGAQLTKPLPATVGGRTEIVMKVEPKSVK